MKNYIYFGMAFSFLVGLLNMTMPNRQKKRRGVQLNDPVLTQEKQVEDDLSH